LAIKILILGGYGTFGGRLARLLADAPELTLLIAGRSKDKAEIFCRQLPAAATLVPLALDRDGDLETQFSQIRPDIVVDATGPFQAYEGDLYRVVKVCLALGINYLDLADGSDFVRGIRQFDNEAKTREVFVLSGVSSFPVLTAAVAKRLSEGLKTVHSIRGGIAPSPYAGVGLNVIRAVMSYTGKPISLIRNGKKSTAYGLTESMRYTIGPPGCLPLNNLHFSLVDVPDLQLLPDAYPQLDSIWMGVGPVPEFLHRMLNGLAWLVKKGIIPSLLPYASFIYQVINVLRWGEHRGGMFVSLKGTDADGRINERSWHLLAEGNDGPFIPSMAIEGIVRHMLEGKQPAVGARSAINELELSDYDALFRRRTIYTGFRGMTPVPAQAPLYQKLLSDAWQTLPEPIRTMHDLTFAMTASGMAKVDRGTSLLSRMAAAIIRFPEAGAEIPVTVKFEVRNNQEIWQRTFAGRSFSSVQSEGRGLSDKLLCERFGLLSFGMALVIRDDRLNLVVRRWSCLGIPLPFFLAPRGDAYEHAEDGRFNFHVEIGHPFAGLIVRYRGWMVPNA
jgi:Domain of unknown function (DUF4166)/Saccharopine dehydrogenase NADP binding domain